MAMEIPLGDGWSPIAQVLATQPGRIISVSETFVKEGDRMTRTAELRLIHDPTQGDAA